MPDDEQIEYDGGNADYAVCCACGGTDELEYGPDPYAAEISGDDTPVWECRECHYQSGMDI